MLKWEGIVSPKPRRFASRGPRLTPAKKSIFSIALLAVVLCSIPEVRAADSGQEPGFAPIFEPGVIVAIGENRRSAINGAAYFARLGLMKYGESNRGWGASISGLYSTKSPFQVDDFPEKRLWLHVQHRRPIGDGFFRYWGLGAGAQIWANFGNDENYKYQSTPLIFESEVGLAGSLAMSLVAEFFSLKSVSPVSGGGYKTSEESIRRISVSFRYRFGE